MNLPRGKRMLLAASCVLLVGAQFDCWGMVDAFDRYPLSRCPDAGFVLPETLGLVP